MMNKKANPLIRKDVERTFSQFALISQFADIKTQAEQLLTAFEQYRPDLKYIQGMSFIMIVLLFHFPMEKAFVLFCNLIITKNHLFKCFVCDPNYLKVFWRGLAQLLKVQNFSLQQANEDKKILLESLYMDWSFTLFSKLFYLQQTLILWDFFLLFEEKVIFSLIPQLSFLLQHESNEKNMKLIQRELVMNEKQLFDQLLLDCRNNYLVDMILVEVRRA